MFDCTFLWQRRWQKWKHPPTPSPYSSLSSCTSYQALPPEVAAQMRGEWVLDTWIITIRCQIANLGRKYLRNKPKTIYHHIFPKLEIALRALGNLSVIPWTDFRTLSPITSPTSPCVILSTSPISAVMKVEKRSFYSAKQKTPKSFKLHQPNLHRPLHV